MKTISYIFIGGGLGAILRHGTNTFLVHLLGYNFPFGILFVNISGSLVMGILVGLMSFTWSPSQELRSFLIVGFLGGYTTFSSFTVDALLLYERGEIALSLIYTLGSVSLSILFLLLGINIVRYMQVVWG